MQIIFNTLKSKYFLWTILLLPSMFMLGTLATNYPLSKERFNQINHTSGEFAVRILILTLYISPLLIVFQNSKFLKWARKHKRSLGLFAFYYTLIHLANYLMYKNYDDIFIDLTQTTYVFGWLGFILLAVLSITSTNYAIKKLGGIKWKNLHKIVYLSAIFVAIHWYFKEEKEIAPIIVHFLPLTLLEINRYLQYKKGL